LVLNSFSSVSVNRTNQNLLAEPKFVRFQRKYFGSMVSGTKQGTDFFVFGYFDFGFGSFFGSRLIIPTVAQARAGAPECRE